MGGWVGGLVWVGGFGCVFVCLDSCIQIETQRERESGRRSDNLSIKYAQASLKLHIEKNARELLRHKCICV